VAALTCVSAGLPTMKIAYLLMAFSLLAAARLNPASTRRLWGYRKLLARLPGCGSERLLE